MGTNDLSACVFCDRIKADEFDYEWPALEVVRFAPLNPVVPGHMLVVPRSHYRDASDVPTGTGRAFIAAADYIAERGGAWNLITSVGSAATQTVRHLHVHCVPRTEGDGLHLPWTGQS